MTDRSLCVGCDKFGVCVLEPLSRHCTLKYKSKDKTFTINADSNRTMSDEELAEFMSYIARGCDYIDCPARNPIVCAHSCKQAWLDWLQISGWKLSI